MVLALVAYPFCYAAYLSLTRKYVGVPPVYVGFENYVRLAYDASFVEPSGTRSSSRSPPSASSSSGHGDGARADLAIRYRNLFTGLLLIPWSRPPWCPR